MRASAPDLVPCRRPSWTSGIAGALVAAAAVALLWREHVVDPRRFAEALRSIGAAPLLVGLVGAVGVVALQALRWWYITRPVIALRYPLVLGATLVGRLLDSALPAGAGELARLQFLSDRAGASRATLLGTEVVDFWTEASGWITAFAVLLPTGVPPRWMLGALVAFAALATASMVVARLARARFPVAACGDGWRVRVARGLAASRSPRRASAGLVLGALPWLWESASIRALMRASGVELEWMQAFALLTAFTIAAFTPLPGNLGPHQAASSVVLASFGVPRDHALALAVVYHGSQLLPSILAGSALLMLGRRAPARIATSGSQWPQRTRT